jgi:diguanylate cyclase (GGDEF)-like protein
MAGEELADVLSEFARTMVTNFPLQRILDHLVQRIVDVMPISGAGVTLISPDSKPRYVAASDDSALRFERLQTDLGEGPCLAAYHTGEAVSAPDLREDERFLRFSPLALEAGLTAVFTFPLNHGDSRLGALDLYSDTPGLLSPKLMKTAQTLADVASAYILNAQARADLEKSSLRANEAALHDALTGLPNRVLMLERVRHALTRRQRSSNTCAVLFVDLDRFKAVNDTYGHQAGDELLVAVAQRVLGALRPGDTFARMSGDEFVILCEDLEDPARADAIAVRVDAALARPFQLSEVEVNVTASIGIAFCGDGDDAEDLIREADRAMYHHKRKRKNAGHRRVFDVREMHLAQEQAGLEHVLSGAVERGELQLLYQPIVGTADRRLVGVEALLRWMHPHRGEISPNIVVPLAEQSGQIIEIGRWVLEQAWTERQRWPTDCAGGFTMFVNVSAHQFMSGSFVGTVHDMLSSGTFDPHLLTLEVTEGVFVRDGQRALIVLNDLKDMGVKIALDDFGTGYSSLSYLMEYPVDTVKIDQTFIAGLAENPASHTIVSAVIQLAHGLGMTVISEGVETAGQYEQLVELGCDACQGFYLARPMPSTQLASLIHHHPTPAT